MATAKRKKATTKKRVPMTVFEQHQLKIARRTMQMSDVGAKIMGGMTKPEAKEFLARMKRQGKI